MTLLVEIVLHPKHNHRLYPQRNWSPPLLFGFKNQAINGTTVIRLRGTIPLRDSSPLSLLQFNLFHLRGARFTTQA